MSRFSIGTYTLIISLIDQPLLVVVNIYQDVMNDNNLLDYKILQLTDYQLERLAYHAGIWSKFVYSIGCEEALGKVKRLILLWHM